MSAGDALPRRAGRAACALGLLLLGGCGGLPNVQPAKVTIYEERSQQPRTAEVPAEALAKRGARPVPADGTHRVVAGDTVYGIARLYGVPIRAVIYANDLQPPFNLNPGQVISIPHPRVHRVSAGDTLYGISRRYDVAMSELVRANRLEAPYRILAGETLILPASAPQLARAPQDDHGRAPVWVDGSTPTLPGGGAPEFAKSEGQAPSAATSGGGIESRPLPPPDGSAPASQPAPASPGDTAAAGAESEMARDAADTASEPAAIAAIPQPDALSTSGFLLPVRGKIVSEFGPKGGGRHNDGINIAAARGTPVRAADHGIVAYAGNELLGFGNLVLLKHADGYMTAYGHADEVVVRRGDRVTRGQTIARVGSTGNVLEPQLHFEIRKGKRAVDPRVHVQALARAS